MLQGVAIDRTSSHATLDMSISFKVQSCHILCWLLQSKSKWCNLTKFARQIMMIRLIILSDVCGFLAHQQGFSPGHKRWLQQAMEWTKHCGLIIRLGYHQLAMLRMDTDLLLILQHSSSCHHLQTWWPGEEDLASGREAWNSWDPCSWTKAYLL